MLDRELVKVARDRVELEISEANTKLRLEIERVKAEMSAQGRLRSGNTVMRITDLCVDAVNYRAHLAWLIYFRFISTAGVLYSSNLGGELKELVAYHVPEKLAVLREHVKQAAQLGGSSEGGLAAQLEASLDAARDTTLAKVGTEIDLFVHSLKKREEKSAESRSTIFNIYSPVGAIQTGSGSISSVIQSIDMGTKDRLHEALRKIQVDLGNELIFGEMPKAEIIELVHESREELCKEKPNLTKLRGGLSAIGASIQTIASMRPAYDALREALALIGVSLP
ncbi:MAG: hypothetical protein HY308_04345 [Gammaproteobacteria bacterium]|nr:hypothetical protein [Gammaproteobacteria bacterium]